MAHWFHRNVLKATTNQKFELKITDPTDATRKLCRLAISLEKVNQMYSIVVSENV